LGVPYLFARSGVGPKEVEVVYSSEFPAKEIEDKEIPTDAAVRPGVVSNYLLRSSRQVSSETSSVVTVSPPTELLYCEEETTKIIHPEEDIDEDSKPSGECHFNPVVIKSDAQKRVINSFFRSQSNFNSVMKSKLSVGLRCNCRWESCQKI
jgi:hypothetical protein